MTGLHDGIKAVLENGLMVDDGENMVYWAIGPMGIDKTDRTPCIVCNSQNNDVDYVEFEDADEAVNEFLSRAGFDVVVT